MLSPNQIQCLNEYYERTRTDLYFCCERHDCDYEQMQAIVAVIDPLMPGRNVDYTALLNGDPIASDPLLIQCNQTIGRLDEIYCQLRSMFQANHGEQQIHKRTTINVPPDWANPSFSDGTFHHNTTHDGTEKIETTTMPSQERFRLLDSAMKCLDRSLKIQITLTNRREKLQNRHKTLDPPRSTPARTDASRSEKKTDAPLRGLEGMRGIQGYSLKSSIPFAPRVESRSTGLAPNSTLSISSPSAPPREQEPVSRDATRSAHPQSKTKPTNNMAHAEISKDSGSPGWSYPTTRAAQPQEASSRTRQHDNTMSQEESTTSEEDPVTSNLSAPPRETDSSPDPTAQFGPPKEFTENPNIAAVRRDPYAWRKEYKARRAMLKSASILSAPSASPRETLFSTPEPEQPAYHQRE